MIRVLHAESQPTGPGGQTIRLVQEVRLLNQRGDCECWVAGQQGGPLVGDMGEDPHFIPFQFPPFKAHPLAIARAVGVLTRIGAQVVHTHSARDAWIFGIAARLRGIPIVRGRHVSRPLHTEKARNFVYSHLADAYTVSGRTIGEILVQGGVAREEQVFRTPGGFYGERFSRSKRDPGFLRRELALPDSARVIGGVANVRQSKGVDVLVDAFLGLRRGAPESDLHLVLAGAADEAEAAAFAAGDPGRIHLMGFRDDIESVIGGMDVMVMPSRRFDGVPQVIPQAMALGVPVVGTRAGGLPDIIEEGVTGFLVAPDAPGALAQEIAQVLEMDAATMDPILDKAEARALAGFTFERVVETYMEAYHWVTGRH